MSSASEKKLRQRVVRAAESLLVQKGYVAPVDVWKEIRWFNSENYEHWRRGSRASLDWPAGIPAPKIVLSVEFLANWARSKGLTASEVEYLSATRDHHPLTFLSQNDPSVELACRTHWMSADIPEVKRERITAAHSKAPDLVVFWPRKPFTCDDCGVADQTGILVKEGEDALCAECADLDHLSYLPRGNTALTRRARMESALSAIVVEWSRQRKRYERQGVLVEENALLRAEEQCLADEDLRARRRERDAERRADEDVEYQARLAAEITRLFPGCPGERAARIAGHAGARSSGRVGRTAAAKMLDPDMVALAVVASVRHEDTDYDPLLMSGVDRKVARDRVRATIDSVLDRWRG